VINLNNVTNVLAANTATGTDISGTVKDSIFGFENAKGGAGTDEIYGSAVANVLDGATASISWSVWAAMIRWMAEPAEIF
jgi:hypothetical protein